MKRILFYLGICCATSLHGLRVPTEVPTIDEAVVERAMCEQVPAHIGALAKYVTDFYEYVAFRRVRGKPVELPVEEYNKYYFAYKALVVLADDGDATALVTIARINGGGMREMSGATESLRSISPRDYCHLAQDGAGRLYYGTEDITEFNDALDAEYERQMLNLEILNKFDTENEKSLYKMMKPLAKAPIFKEGEGLTFISAVNLKNIEIIAEGVKGVVGKDMLGRTGSFTPSITTWIVFEKDYTGGFGWKIHVSARPSSASRIAGIVVPILKELNMNYKIVPSLQALRRLYLRTRHKGNVSQGGKYIAIYPRNDEEARAVAEALDRALNAAIENGALNCDDFLTCVGDVRIGLTGGIYARLCDYQDDSQESMHRRRMPVVSAKEVARDVTRADEAYEHPFVKLGAAYCGLDLPNRISDWKEVGLLYDDGTASEAEKARHREILGRTIYRPSPTK
jgi:hypothetical protein